MTTQNQTTTYVQVRPYVWLVYPSDLTKADKFNAWFGVGPSIYDLSRILKVEHQDWILEPEDPAFTSRGAYALTLINSINSHRGWAIDIPVKFGNLFIAVLKRIGANLDAPRIVRNGDMLHFYAIAGPDCHAKIGFLKTRGCQKINTETLDERFPGGLAVQTPPTPSKAPITDPGAIAGWSKPALEALIQDKIQAKAVYQLLSETRERLVATLEPLNKISKEYPIYRGYTVVGGGLHCVLDSLDKSQANLKYLINHHYKNV